MRYKVTHPCFAKFSQAKLNWDINIYFQKGLILHNASIFSTRIIRHIESSQVERWYWIEDQRYGLGGIGACGAGPVDIWQCQVLLVRRWAWPAPASQLQNDFVLSQWLLFPSMDALPICSALELDSGPSCFEKPSWLCWWGFKIQNRNPHFFTLQCKHQTSWWCGMTWGDGQSEVTFPITSVMIGFFYQMTFFLSSASIQCLWTVPQAPCSATLQFLWLLGFGPSWLSPSLCALSQASTVHIQQFYVHPRKLSPLFICWTQGFPAFSSMGIVSTFF